MWEVRALDETFDHRILNPLQRFGLDVRQVRLARRITQKHLGRATGYSEAYVSLVETGKQRPSPRFAKGCDTAFGTGELFSGLLHRIEEGDHPSWFWPYLELEGKASGILDYSVTSIMGLLQTEEYARAIFRAGYPRACAEIIRGKVEARLERRHVLNETSAPTVWVVLHEACLRTVVGGPRVMAEQLAYLVDAADSPRADIQVIPFSAGASAAHLAAFTLLTFDSSPTVLYSDGPSGGKLYDRADTVSAALENYDRLRADALSLTGSRDLMLSVMEEYRHEH
ncbi:helix-turn-helix transcriptional regulator [Streptomyces sp. TRM70308]|uniref:helix-turn-helix domain-containing protein n=1 Tax=Streptomyces sp. TRM70308 TaxID=3131932 RepID=UPI003CFEEF94